MVEVNGWLTQLHFPGIFNLQLVNRRLVNVPLPGPTFAFCDWLSGWECDLNCAQTFCVLCYSFGFCWFYWVIVIFRLSIYLAPYQSWSGCGQLIWPIARSYFWLNWSWSTNRSWTISAQTPSPPARRRRAGVSWPLSSSQCQQLASDESASSWKTYVNLLCVCSTFFA